MALDPVWVVPGGRRQCYGDRHFVCARVAQDHLAIWLLEPILRQLLALEVEIVGPRVLGAHVQVARAIGLAVEQLTCSECRPFGCLYRLDDVVLLAALAAERERHQEAISIAGDKLLFSEADVPPFLG